MIASTILLLIGSILSPCRECTGEVFARSASLYLTCFTDTWIRSSTPERPHYRGCTKEDEAIASSSFQALFAHIVLQLAAPTGMPEPIERLALDLADAFSRQAELFPYFLERVCTPVLQPKAQA